MLNNIIKHIQNLLKNFEKYHKYYPYIIFIYVLVLGVILSHFRVLGADETTYYLETKIIYETFKNGNWIGNQPVGTHGFISKMLVAVVFLITKPSIFIATIFNVLCFAINGVIIYKIFKYFFNSKNWALASTFVIINSYNWMLNLPTYLRDGVSFLLVSLIIYEIIKKNRIYIISLWLLLLLDSKEYLSFILLIPLIIYLIHNNYKKHSFSFKFTYSFLYNFAVIIIPFLAYIVLMFSTQLIPVNPLLGVRVLPLQKNKDPLKTLHISLDHAMFQSNYLKENYKNIPLLETKSNETKKNNINRFKNEKPTTIKIENNDENKIISESANKENIKKTSAPEKKKQDKTNEQKELGEKNEATESLVTEEQNEKRELDVINKSKSQLEKEQNKVKIDDKEKLDRKEKREKKNNKNVLYHQVKNTFIAYVINPFIAYSQKIMYPRVFSFLSLPKFVMVISFIYVVLFYRKRLKQPEMTFLMNVAIVFLMIFIMRASHGRYLLQFMHVFMIFFTMIMMKSKNEYKLLYYSLLISLIFTTIGFFFEIRFLSMKIFINAFFYLTLFQIAYYSKKQNYIYRRILIAAFFVAYSFIGLASSLYAYYDINQLGDYLKYGRNMQYDKIAKYFPVDKKIWSNVDRRMIYNYAEDPINRFPIGFNKWNNYHDWIPRKKFIEPYQTWIYRKPYPNVRFIKENNIDRIIILKLKDKKNKYVNLNKVISKLVIRNVISGIDTIQLKNKSLEIYKTNKEML